MTAIKPNNWEKIKIEDISLRIHYGYTVSSTKKNTGVKLLRITDIQNYRVDWDHVPFCEIDSYDVEKYLLEDGDIVFARTGATVGKSYLIQGKIPKAVFASYLIRIQLSKYINPKYLYYFFQSADYWRQIGIKAMGIGQPNVNATSLSNISLLLSPLNEQNRIVAKLEELFSELDQAENDLREIQQQLEIYKQSILKSAFTGKLTKNWRDQAHTESAKALVSAVKIKRESQYQTKLKKWENDYELWNKEGKNGKSPTKPKIEISIKPFSESETGVFSKLPSNWMWVKTQEIADVIMGQSPDGSSYNDKGIGVPLINGPVEFGPTPFSQTILSKWTTAPTKMCEGGDLILCVRGSTTGRQNIAGFNACLGRGVAAIRAVILSPRYLYHYFNYVRDRIFELGTGTTFPSISQEQLTSFPIPVSSNEEQELIVQEIEYRFTIADHLEHTIKSNLKSKEAFRLSILQRAFTGKLVDPDADDEPTNKLLILIRDEKENYLAQEKISAKSKPKRVQIMEMDKSILEILQENPEPLSAKDIWTASVHKNDIDSFYAVLKKHLEDGEIIELERKGKECLLTINKSK